MPVEPNTPPTRLPLVFGSILVLITLLGTAILNANAQDDDKPPVAPSSIDAERQVAQQAFDGIEFILKSKDADLDASQFTITDITPHTSGPNGVNVGLALINDSPTALEALHADVLFMDEKGMMVSTDTINIHQRFQPTAEPEDRMHTDIHVPITPPIKQVVIALHSQKTLPVTPRPTPKAIPIEWIEDRPEGCELSAHVREESPRVMPGEPAREHNLELAVFNTGACPLQVILLEKRTYSADHKLIDSEQSYLNAYHDPPLRHSKHLLITLKSAWTKPFEYYKVVVLSISTYAPPTQ